MVKRTGPTNIYLRKLIHKLKKEGKKNEAGIYLYLAKLLNRSTRKRVEVNLGKLQKYAKDGDTVVIPGKLLASNNFNKKLTISVWRYSQSAREKAEKAGSTIISIEELLEANPKGSNVKIII
ncbi:50S ribosomal protein L18e [Nanobdella aerobiophila]|uniref:Large ribosomal subunit protein eL18 n=1 Tax=Nanobdella aerobiophila TaxID=2586965 RepID=A0A915SKJ9_9ARCH|nr:50S ribosomal protein L18e [Nanobdella aerobiophila]BBL45391.1 50S ribosomal protein L18e [Nanobdella aerobiophila]